MEDDTAKFVTKLRQAKIWSDQLQVRSDSGENVHVEIESLERHIEILENQSKELIKQMGCVSPDTRTVYQNMADMIISWQIFKDKIGAK